MQTFTTLVNGSWARETAPSDEEAPDPVTLTGPLGISASPRLADRLLLVRRNRAPGKDSGQEQNDQDAGKGLPHYSIT